MKSYESIPGWYDYSVTYKDIVFSLSGGILVEVGNYFGRSLCHLGQLVKESNKDFKVIGVDNCSANENNIAGQLFNNILECGLLGTVSLIITDSYKAAKLFPDNSLAMVFLDASHDYDSIRSDIEAWLPKVRTNGILAGDDVGLPNEEVRVWPGVKKAVDELLPGWVYSPHDCWLYVKR